MKNENDKEAIVDESESDFNIFSMIHVCYHF